MRPRRKISDWMKGAMQSHIQHIPRNMHTVFALRCFVVVIHWLIFPYPPGFLHWHWGNLTIAPVPAKQPWWIWINTSCEFIMNDCIATAKQSTTKPCAYFLGYTVLAGVWFLTCEINNTDPLIIWRKHKHIFAFSIISQHWNCKSPNHINERTMGLCCEYL